ncbi:MAG: two-component regulator propeller domain-containing protein [Nibricoccus sp.]
MNRSYLSLFAWVMAVLLEPRDLFAAEYSLREWHGEDGLPNEMVQGVTQDVQGYLWVAADVGGVARFNGIRFDVPQSVAQAAPTLFARSLVTHPDLGLLFSSNSGEIWQWDGHVLRKNSVTDQFSKQHVQTWHVQHDGTLWAGFFEGKVEVLRDGHVSEVKLEGVKMVRQLVSFASDGSDGVWIAAGSLLFHASNGNATKITPPWRETELRIASSRHGHPWIVARDVVGRWNGREIEAAVKIPELLGAHYVRALLEDKEGNLWVGTRSQGAYLVTNNDYQAVPTSHRTVTSIFQDNEGNIWLGTGGGGLARLQAKHFRLYDSKSGLRDDVTLSVCEDAQGQIWFANRDGGVARVAKTGIEVMTGRNKWPKTNANRIASDVTGGVWFSGGAGLWRMDEVNGIRRIDIKTFDAFRVMFSSRTGELWLTGDTGGLGRLNKTDFTVFGPDAGLPNQLVSCIAEDAEGRILVGTTEGMLFRFDGNRFESMRRAGAEPLPSIRVMAAEKDGTLWIATETGLVLIHEGSEHFLTSTQGLPEGVISQMLFDDFGAVWLGSPRGIFRVERREIAECLAGRTNRIHPATFGKNEGFAHISCVDGYQPNSVKGRDGMLWFTTRLGVLAIDPNVVRRKGSAPVFIDELRVDDVVRPLSSVVKVRCDMHKIELRFSVLNFTAPERTQARHRLEGFDQEWIDAGAERRIVYPRLLPGSYNLRIVSADEESEMGDSGATLQIVVVPFWWQTVWFRFGAGAAVIALLVLGVRARSHRRLRNKLERVERESAVDRERTRIARDIHDELGASLTRISLLTQSSPPEATTESARNCFNEIHATTTEITRSIDEIVWAVDAQHDNLDSLVSYFDSYAQGFLSVAKIRYRLAAPRDIPEVKVNSTCRHHLFLAFKEALNNCIKHARATEVFIRIECTAERFGIVIVDNGGGMAATAPLRAGGGNGLPNLAARMTAIGGECTVRDADNGGAEVRLVIPVNKLNS